MASIRYPVYINSFIIFHFFQQNNQPGPRPRAIEINEGHPMLHRDHDTFMLSWRMIHGEPRIDREKWGSHMFRWILTYFLQETQGEMVFPSNVGGFTTQFSLNQESDGSNQSVSISGHQQSINEMGISHNLSWLKGGFPNSFGFNQQTNMRTLRLFPKKMLDRLVNGNWGKQPSSGDAKQKTTALTCHFLIFLWQYVMYICPCGFGLNDLPSLCCVPSVPS